MGAVHQLDEERAIRRPPARTTEEAENRLIGLATDLAEKQMREGTASAQVITHYLKLGSSREHLEQERMRLENSLTGAKIEALEAHGRVEELYTQALSAMRSYQGVEDPMGSDDDAEYDY